MARSRNRGQFNSARQKKPSGKGGVIVLVVVLFVVLLGCVCILLPSDESFKFSRAYLDAYVEKTTDVKPRLGDTKFVYVDMSDGMNFAYSTDESKKMLEAVINKLAARNDVEFFGLANLAITPIKQQESHTELYNYICNPRSYANQKAPIEETLKKIVADNTPALVMSDFEEYKGGVIEVAAYAKKYFIEWLSKGNYITFYKWAFTEHGKNKWMFLAVFDDNSNRLYSEVDIALTSVNPNIEKYVLGGYEYAYPTSTNYLSLKQGGNFHNANGKDVVTAVSENGGDEDYISYSKPLAVPGGVQGLYTRLDQSVGTFAEYYPIGLSWDNVIANINAYKEVEEGGFTHLLSNLYIDFEDQDGFLIEGVEARVFNLQNRIVEVAGQMENENFKFSDGGICPEVNEMFQAGMIPARKGDAVDGAHLYVDLHEKFSGKFPDNVSSSDLLQVDLVVSKAYADLDKVQEFFNWDGNACLANSVKEVLQAETCSPVGRTVFTYYIKTLGE